MKKKKNTNTKSEFVLTFTQDKSVSVNSMYRYPWEIKDYWSREWRTSWQYKMFFFVHEAKIMGRLARRLTPEAAEHKEQRTLRHSLLSHFFLYFDDILNLSLLSLSVSSPLSLSPLPAPPSPLLFAFFLTCSRNKRGYLLWEQLSFIYAAKQPVLDERSTWVCFWTFCKKGSVHAASALLPFCHQNTHADWELSLLWRLLPGEMCSSVDLMI